RQSAAPGLQGPVDLCGSILSDEQPRWHAAIVGDDDVLSILINNTHRLAVEEVAVLAEDVGFRPLSHHGISGQHEHVVESPNLDVETHVLPRTKPPQYQCLVVLLATAGLVDER